MIAYKKDGIKTWFSLLRLILYNELARIVNSAPMHAPITGMATYISFFRSAFFLAISSGVNQLLIKAPL